MKHPILKSAKTSRSSAVLLMCGLAMGFALLFWLKLRVVTGVPRTAYADPSAPQAPANVDR